MKWGSWELRFQLHTCRHRNGLVNEKDMLWNIWQWKRYALERLARREKGVLRAAHTYTVIIRECPPPPPPPRGQHTAAATRQDCPIFNTNRKIMAFCVKSDVYPSKLRSKDVKMRKSTTQQVIIPKVSQSFPAQNATHWRTVSVTVWYVWYGQLEHLAYLHQGPVSYRVFSATKWVFSDKNLVNGFQRQDSRFIKIDAEKFWNNYNFSATIWLIFCRS